MIACIMAWSRLVRSYPSGWQIYLQREGQQQPELLVELVGAETANPLLFKVVPS